MTEATPPSGLAAPQEALWWIGQGGLTMGPAWHRAHALAQQGEGKRQHDLVHALLHRIEGDDANADYWYRSAGETRPNNGIKAEYERLKSLIGQEA